MLLQVFLVICFIISIQYADMFHRKSSFRAKGSLSMSNREYSSTAKGMVFSSILATSLASTMITTPPMIASNQYFHATSSVVHAAGTVSSFQGEYTDPFHPGCLRKITVEGKKVTIIGSDDVDSKKIWKLNAVEEKAGEILVDFSPKGGPKDLLGKYSLDKNRIEWPDGNAWTKK
jgi:hypothetical protein